MHHLVCLSHSVDFYDPKFYYAMREGPACPCLTVVKKGSVMIKHDDFDGTIATCEYVD